MSEQRLFVANFADGASGETELTQAQSHYLLNVLRLSRGSRLLVFDGKSGEWRAEIVAARKSCVIRPIEKVREQTAAQDIHYAFAPLKQGRLDYMVQKAVEMGASELRPVITAHTAVSRLNIERMQANAIEAAEQCGVLSIPRIEAPVKLEALLKTCETGRTVVFCDERARASSPVEALEKLKGRKLAALVGPEGGFSESERDMLLSRSFVCPISLGPRIMRADTAAVAVLALLNAVLGDWRP
ncbi:MAG: 16S rRNA (uracil(1498)-N(3))-methyltransferase [Rhodomicrobium sp.]|jgi:16S rRNA (uracil1498-N3)-methyltransferase